MIIDISYKLEEKETNVLSRSDAFLKYQYQNNNLLMVKEKIRIML